MYFDISINLDKIDQSRVVEGKKGRYLNLSGFLSSTKDEYGNDISVWQKQTKEESERKDKRNYLGNGRQNKRREEAAPQQPSHNEPDPFENNTQAPTAAGGSSPNNELDDLPF